jgi:hypothetical protein
MAPIFRVKRPSPLLKEKPFSPRVMTASVLLRAAAASSSSSILRSTIRLR